MFLALHHPDKTACKTESCERSDKTKGDLVVLVHRRTVKENQLAPAPVTLVRRKQAVIVYSVSMSDQPLRTKAIDE